MCIWGSLGCGLWGVCCLLRVVCCVVCVLCVCVVGVWCGVCVCVVCACCVWCVLCCLLFVLRALCVCFVSLWLCRVSLASACLHARNGAKEEDRQTDSVAMLYPNCVRHPLATLGSVFSQHLQYQMGAAMWCW